jgi:hypothetical protein
MAFEHLKHLTDNNRSPLLLAACITGHDYNDALMILREQAASWQTQLRPGSELKRG